MTIEEDIKTDVVDHLKWDARVDASKVSVTVDSNTVTLEGEVPSYSAKTSAFDDAWNVQGVFDVDNQLKVKYPSEDILTDVEIKSNLENKFAWDPNLNSMKIDTEVENQWVELQGTVDEYWKLVDAETKASDMDSVIGVTNKLVVVPSESVTDELIGKDIAEAIERSKNVLIDDIDIEVENGKVTLTGVVNDWKAKSAAYDAALYTTGVIEVIDNIVVNSG